MHPQRIMQTVIQTQRRVPKTATGTENTEGLTFADLAEYQFEFCSGAGGWATDFTIDSDGHFSGEYHDSDMGVTGDGYETEPCI